MLVGCSTIQVDPASGERHDACERGWSCAVECHAPVRELVELGCAAGDFASVPPMCAMTDNCDDAKRECFEQCEEDHADSDDVTACKVDCYDTFGNDGACRESFDQWLAQRDEILRPLAVCLRPCEGGQSRAACDDPSVCGPVVFAQHKGVDMAEACALGDDDACAWTCDDPVTGFPAF